MLLNTQEGRHAFGVDDAPLLSISFPVPFPGWVTSAERYWVTFS